MQVGHDKQIRADLGLWLRRLLRFGLMWLFAGMAVLPAGVSYNPGHFYQYVLGLTLYLPALLLLVLQPGSFALLWRQPSMKWVLALLSWGVVSLAWSTTAHPSSELGRSVSIVLFLYGWTQAIEGKEDYIRRLLTCAGVVMTLAALAAMLVFQVDDHGDGRLSAFGVMNNANLAAAAMAAAVLWLSAWTVEAVRYRIAQAVAVAVLVLFVFLTFTRSAWGGLFAALLVFCLCQHGARARWQVIALLVLGCAGAAFTLPDLTNRGWSLRPEILRNSWQLFQQHPWLGMGQGAVFNIDVGGLVLTHAHNLFSQLAIELGVPGLLMGLVVWGMLGWRGWQHRYEVLGRLVLSTWVLATIIVQFDLPHLIDSPRPTWLLTWLPLAMSFSLGGRESQAPGTDST
ncbi:O-antigen ligase family protein [Fulvimonas sp. R45]|uniref:O-antigen ligase family protein n=1 Tax=Fulvimonas sp. R45 TaxID=3045937 RepID=UPI00265D76B8|nr:O-antigen ligase family protein [Fulvimonas sp. R45]MDO1529807.1 O-antigen ligase family protein [Fulvimonas sp. R45]